MNRFIKPSRPANALKSAHTETHHGPTLSQVGTWEWDFSSGDVRWSDGLHRLLGIKPGSVPASYDLFVSRVHPDDRLATETAVRAMMTRGHTIDHEFRIIRDDGVRLALEAGRTVTWDYDIHSRHVTRSQNALEVLGIGQHQRGLCRRAAGAMKASNDGVPTTRPSATRRSTSGIGRGGAGPPAVRSARWGAASAGSSMPAMA